MKMALAPLRSGIPFLVITILFFAAKIGIDERSSIMGPGWYRRLVGLPSQVWALLELEGEKSQTWVLTLELGF